MKKVSRCEYFPIVNFPILSNVCAVNGSEKNNCSCNCYVVISLFLLLVCLSPYFSKQYTVSVESQVNHQMVVLQHSGIVVHFGKTLQLLFDFSYTIVHSPLVSVKEKKIQSQI